VRFALSTILVLVAAFSALAQDTDDALFARAEAARRSGDLLAARALLQEHVKLHPGSPRAAAVLLELARTFSDDDLTERAAGLEVLGRLHRTFPESRETRESVSMVQALGGAIFVRVASDIVAEHQGLWYERGRRESEFHVYRIPPELYRAAIEAAPVETKPDLLGIALAIPRQESWKVVPGGIRFGDRDESLEWARNGAAPVVSAGILLVRENQDGFEARHVIRVQSFGLDVRLIGGCARVRAAELWTGEPVVGLEVSVRTSTRRVALKTDADGLASFELVGPAIVLAARGDDIEAVAVEAPAPVPVDRVFITTDRPAYRPGQTVSFKAVRRGSGPKMARVEVLDPERRVLLSRELAWTADGTLSGSLELADETPLGTWRVTVRGGDELSQKTFEVAAFKPAEMAVSVTLRGAPENRLEARVHADYAFGSPVAGAHVEWRALRRFAREESTKETDSTGDEIASGEGMTSAAGDLDVLLATPPVPEDEDASTQDVTLTARVHDVSHVESEGSATLRGAASRLRVSVSTPDLFYVEGGIMKPSVRVTTSAGAPVARRAVELVCFRSEWTHRGERELESFFSARVVTDATGLATAEVPVARSGAIRVRARVRDDLGDEHDGRVDLLVAGDACAKVPANAIDSSVQADRLLYEEGETARLLVLSPGATTALLTVEGGAFFESRRIRLEKRWEVVSVPLRAAFAPNVFIRIVGWKEGVAVGGGVEVQVYPRSRFLDVGVQPDNDHYAPREKARVWVATSTRGRPVPAEVELTFLDESLDGQAPDIRAFFAPWRGESAGTGTLPESAATKALAVRPPTVGARVASEAVRYFAHVRTSGHGLAGVEIDMPDVPGRWRIVARAVSGERVGEARTTVVTRKDVALRLLAPRFLVEQDECVLATVVHNGLTAAIDVAVRLRCEGGSGDTGDRRISVPAGSARRLEWRVRSTAPGTMKVHAEVVGFDAVEVAVPVGARGIEHEAAVGARVDGAWHARVTLPEGVSPVSASLDVVATAGGSGAVTEALSFLSNRPYGSVEETVSRLLDVPHRDTVERALQGLYAFQHEDGGWGRWTRDETDPVMTAYAVQGLVQARAAGFAVDSSTLERGLERLRDLPVTPLALYARARAGDDVREALAAMDPKDAEEIAYLVLAGRRELATKLPAAPPATTGPDVVRRTALVVRALAAIDARDSRIAPLVDWLLVARRGAAWFSTRDSACAVEALRATAAPEKAIAVHIKVNGEETGSGRVRTVLLRAGANEVAVESSGTPVYASALLCWRAEAESREKGVLVVGRRIERRVGDGFAPVAIGGEVKVGDELRLVLTVRAPGDPVAHVMLESPLAGGTEARDTDEDAYYRRELHADRVAAPVESVESDERTVAFHLRATVPGVYHVAPAVAWSMDDPQKRGASEALLLRVVGGK
jgi:uncharacterized protein YfaS (alpha-2-macroglobulin family)